jgi:CheY-like chemotaxis protein
VTTPPEGLWVEADPTRVHQVLFNLVGNAVKFTLQGEVKVQLDYTPRDDGTAQVAFLVSDTGIGISEDMRARLFQRFSRAEDGDARRFGGAGLGLSIAQAVAERMGGAITVASREGVGSRFRFAFDAPSAAAPQPSQTTSEPLSGVRLLVADDNVTNRLVASTLLRRLGAEVLEAEDGLQALDQARRGTFDLVLMDIQMPHMDGVEATRAIRALDSEAALTPIIALTANAMAHQTDAYRQAGMNGIVAKPIAPAALLSEIARVLQEV